MRSLTMAVRSLRVSARDPMLYAVRGGLVGLVVVALIIAVATRGSFGAPGLNFFRGLVTIDLVGVTALGLASFSMVITEEKQAETLSLLSLAGFRPISILLGKSLGLLAITVMLLIAQVPFAVLAVTLGGVAPNQVWAAYVILFAYAFFVYGVALLCSTVCKRDAGAARATGIVIACVFGLPWLLDQALRILTASGSLAPAGAMATAIKAIAALGWEVSVLRELFGVFQTNFAGALLGRSGMWNFGLGLCCVLLAWILFPLQSREVLSDRQRPRRLLTSREESQRPRARSSALAWKDFHFVAGGPSGRRRRFVIYGLASLVLLPLVQQPGFGTNAAMVAWGSAITAFHAVAIIVEAGLVAGRVLRIEVQEKTLLGLALLPSRLSSSASEKVRGSMEVIRVPVIYLGIGIAIGIVCSGRIEYLLGAVFASGFVGFVYVSLLIFVVQLTLYISLWLRRGAFAVAIGGMLVVYGLLSTAMTAAGATCCGVVLVPGGLLLGSVALQVRVAKRLRELAGSSS